MKLRTRFLNRLINDEVEEYLDHNDLIIVPVGTVEMHGGMPLDSETVVSEGLALKMAEKLDALVLPNLPYFYAGATATGRGTTQVSVRAGIDYLGAIARSLLRQGFKRQIYLSLHGPAHMTICPMVRDFFDETGVPILYLDVSMAMEKLAAKQVPHAATEDPTNRSDNADAGRPKNPEAAGGMANMLDVLKMFDSMIIGAYDLLGRIEDVPLLTDHLILKQQSTAGFSELFGAAYQSGSMGYYFGEKADHMPTSQIPDAETRQAMADEGKKILDGLVAEMDLTTLAKKLTDIRAFEEDVFERYPWTPAAYARKPYNLG